MLLFQRYKARASTTLPKWKKAKLTLVPAFNFTHRNNLSTSMNLFAYERKTNREQWISKLKANRRFYFRITTTEHHRLN